MKRLLILAFAVVVGVACATPSSAQLISEFEPNPAGGDPADTTFELSGGTSGDAFDFFILSLENDGFSGTVDSADAVTGTFDANGLAVVTVPDLENPSFTLVLTDAFTGLVGDDLDANDDGTLDLSSVGTILDAISVSDAVADDSTLYAGLIGGTDILFNGQFEPLSVFRDGTTGELYNTVTIDFGDPTERIGVFNAAGVELDVNDFDVADPTALTFGATNPSFTGAVVPEPSSFALLGVFGCAGLVRRRRN